MLGFIYISISIFFGISLIMLLINTESIYETISGEEYSKKIPKTLFIMSAGITVGIMTTTVVNYFIIYFLNKIKQNNEINYPVGITLTILFCLIFTIINFNKINKKNKQEKNTYKKKDIIYYIIICALIIAISTFATFNSYRIVDGKLKIGFASYADIALHTAMTSSFGNGGNIPTQYMYFPGDGVNWHFFFYFFAGILNYLGFSIDFAINIPSILSLLSVMMLLGTITQLLSKKKIAFAIAPILFLFRGGFDIFILISNLITKNIPIIRGILENNVWIFVRPRDDWGMWSFNVYMLQRHLIIGIAALLIVFVIFLPYLIEMINSIKKIKIKEKIKKIFFSKEAWICTNYDKRIIIALLLVITLPYFHGSALIALLLVLFGMAIFSKNKLGYLFIAIIAILASIIQTKIFSGGASNVVNLKFQTGFMMPGEPFFEILKYILFILGLSSALSVLLVVISKNNRLLYSVLFISFLLPLAFAFLFSITLFDMNHHKFIQVSIVLLNIFAAIIVAKLFENNGVEKGIKIFVGIEFLVLLTATGVSEWITMININENYVTMNTESSLVAWIKDNTEKEDVFLTPRWTGHEFFFAGRPTFHAWPFYAWANGHDTNTREKEYIYLLQGCDGNKETFVEYCKEHNIKYLIDNKEMFDTKDEETETSYYNQSFVHNNFELVARFKEDIRIYKIY